VKRPSPSLAIGVAGVAAAAAAVGIGVGQLELAGRPQPDIWSNAWLISAMVIAGAALLIAAVVLAADFLGHRGSGVHLPAGISTSSKPAQEGKLVTPATRSAREQEEAGGLDPILHEATPDTKGQRILAADDIGTATFSASDAGRNGPMPAEGAPLVVTIERDIWEGWHHRVYIVALRVKITNTTEDSIQLESTELDNDWNEDVSSLTLSGSEEQATLKHEIDAARRTRYSPDLRAYSYVPPRESISGWLVASAPRRAKGGTPRLTLSVNDVFGNQYLAVIHAKEPQVYRS
jgi:hypothetical protein